MQARSFEAGIDFSHGVIRHYLIIVMGCEKDESRLCDERVIAVFRNANSTAEEVCYGFWVNR